MTVRSGLAAGQRFRKTCSVAGGSESESSNTSPTAGKEGSNARTYGFLDGDGSTERDASGGSVASCVGERLGVAVTLPELVREGDSEADCDAVPVKVRETESEGLVV